MDGNLYWTNMATSATGIGPTSQPPAPPWELVGESIPWTISGPDSGTVQGVSFQGFANLSGQDTTADAFLFSAAGSLSGTLDGGGTPGDGIIDGLAVTSVVNGVDNVVTVNPSTAGPGTYQTTGGRTIHYTGIDPYLQFDATSPSHVVINGSAFNDNIVVQDANPGANDGKLQVTVGSNSWSPLACPGTHLPLSPSTVARAAIRSRSSRSTRYSPPTC
jgi:hypothetical protein